MGGLIVDPKCDLRLEMDEPLGIERLVDEVASGNFADERLTARLRRLVEGLAKDPTFSLPRAFDSAGLEGAYRFLSNQRVTPDDILASHCTATRERCQAQETVLVVHDTTSFSYRWDGEREGLGRALPRNKASNQTFLAHFSLALKADGTRIPLGVAGFKTWTRSETPNGIEYQRWEDQIRASSAALNGLANAIHVADREADDYEMFCALKRDGHRFVMRAVSNRLLDVEGEQAKLHDFFSKVDATATRAVPLSRRGSARDKTKDKTHPPRQSRDAQLSFAAATIELKRPKSPRPHSRLAAPPKLELNVVRVWEASPPEGETAVEWYLYTTEPIDTVEQLLAVVDYYRARWVIEEYIKAIKTGCDFERRQLQDYEALVNLLAVFAPIACRMLHLRSEAARAPDDSPLKIISQDELDVLRVLGRIKLTASPTTREIYFAIAALGGHIKYNGNPGWQTLAYGIEKLVTLTEGWVAAKFQQSRDQS
jgi:hypothetical protein